jgi:glutamate-1-semialdehyde 2,1-aminomutase
VTFAHPGSRAPLGILRFLRAGATASFPSYLTRGEGAYVWDDQGRRFIDWVAGKGAVTLGHARAEVDARAAERARGGFLFAGCPLEYEELADRLAELLPCAEKTVFAKNGSDAVQIALRLGRTFTGRQGVASAGYHGWDQQGVRDFGYDLKELAAIADQSPGSLAAVLVTPEPAFFDAEWLERCAEIARSAGALLILDEVRAGMRIRHGGAHELFGVRPDLICLSKGLANGYPLAAVSGRADVLDASDRTYIFGTYYADAVALAAGLACLEIYVREAVIDQLWNIATRLMRGLEETLHAEGIQARSIGPGPMSQLVFEEQPIEEAFYERMVARGVLIWAEGPCPSACHGAAEIEATLTAAREVAREIRNEQAPSAARELGRLTPGAIFRSAERRRIRASALDPTRLGARHPA